MTREHLMIVMAGDKSVHENNIKGNRNFDVWVVYYGNDDDVARRYSETADRFWRAKGMKVELLRDIIVRDLHFRQNFDFTCYKYVFMPDDDIIFDGVDAVNAFLDACTATGADCAQPAISNNYWSHVSTQKVDQIAAHSVNWIEIMMPAYRSDLFQNAFIPVVHQLDFLVSGFGIEIMVQKLCETHRRRPTKNLILDSHAVVHSRPVGTNKAIHARGELEAFFIPQRQWMFGMKTLREFKSLEEAAAFVPSDYKEIFFEKAVVEEGISKYKPLIDLNIMRRSITSKFGVR